MDERSGLCLGCARTRLEIATWKEAGEEDRNLIWSQLPARRASLGIKTHRLGWTLGDIRAFILETLKANGGTWVSGIYGAVAEFCIGEAESVTLNVGERAVAAMTPRGAISFNLPEHVHVFSIGVPGAPISRDIVLFAVPLEQAAPIASHGLTCVAQDGEAIKPGHRCESLYDFGLGSITAGFGIRTADPGLVANLGGWLGRIYPDFLPVLGKDILQTSPTRVVRNRLGRIEVFTPIPLPNGRSPCGPHTHFLPDHLALGGDLPPNLQVPAGYISCFIHYPARPSEGRGH